MCEFYFYPIGHVWMVHIEQQGALLETFGGFNTLEDAVEQARNDSLLFGCSPDFTPRVVGSKSQIELAKIISGESKATVSECQELRRQSARRLESLFRDLTVFIGKPDELEILADVESEITAFKLLGETLDRAIADSGA